MLNHGHVGPVRFITSVDIPKQGQTMQQAASNLHQNEAASSSNLTSNSTSTATMVTNSYYRTVVITGGEGYDEYKSSSSNLTMANVNSVGISLSNLVSSSANIAVTTTATNSSQQQQQQQAQQLHQQQQQHSDSNAVISGGSNTNSNLSGSPISANTVSSNNATSILDDAVIGKEDLVNYILTWET